VHSVTFECEWGVLGTGRFVCARHLLALLIGQKKRAHSWRQPAPQRKLKHIGSTARLIKRAYVQGVFAALYGVLLCR